MDYSNNSLTITSRAETAFCGLEDVFSTMYCRRDFDRVMKHVRLAKGSSRNARFLPKLYEMFDDCGIDYEEGRENSYYEKLIEDKISKDVYDDAALEDRMILALYDRFDGYAAPSEYMDRLMVRLQKKEDQEKWSGSSLRVRILKQFVKYGNYLEDVGYGSRPTIEKQAVDITGKKKKELTVLDVADAIDEDVFKEFDNPKDEQKAKNDRKPKGKHGLLKLCDDLAYGKFRTQGGTKKGLYLLAMVLNMRLGGFPGANQENDVLKNLFRDYYTNNLMRYMTDAYKGHLREFENPSGQGVNFKNFAEMVYLYYIAKDDMEPQEKVRLSSLMIDELAKTAKENRPDGKKQWKESKQTEFYRRHFMHKDPESGMEIFSEDILGLDEEQFKVFLISNYDCDTGTGDTFIRHGEEVERSVSPIQMDIDQNTAFKVYNEIIDELVKELKKRGMGIEECNYGLCFIDVASYKKKGLVSFPEKHREIDSKRFDDFMEVLLGTNNLIGITVNEDASEKTEEQEHTDVSRIKIGALSVTEARDITRTSLMTAFYYYFNAVHEDEGDHDWTNYGELFDEFKKELDPMLEQCGYQEVSGKCIFDVLLTFSSYARIILS